MNKLRRFYKAMKMELKEHKSSFLVYLILRILVIVVLCVQIHERNFESVFLSVLTLLMLLIPSFVQVTFRIELPTVLESIILLFIFAAQILGEINGFYVKIPFWDTMLHTLIGLYDTMYDLIVNFIGAFVFSAFAFIYLKKKENEKLMGRFIMRRKKKEEDYLQ